MTTLLEGARRLLVPAGGTLHRTGDGERHVSWWFMGWVRVLARGAGRVDLDDAVLLGRRQ
ncbi:MAG TPA: hypothetical protein VH520_02285 [Streptosporangiaceae bacterium]